MYHNGLYVGLKRPTLIITILYVLFYSNSKYILMMSFYMNGLSEYMLILAYFLFLAKKEGSMTDVIAPQLAERYFSLI